MHPTTQIHLKQRTMSFPETGKRASAKS